MNDSTQDYGRGNSGNNGMLSFVLGAAVGAGIALLFAPDSGVETRRRLGRTAGRLRSSLNDGVGQARDRVSELSADVGGRLGELKQDVATAVQEGRDAFTRDREARRIKP